MKRELAKKTDKELSMMEKCKLLELNRSSLYYKAKPVFSDEDISIMHKIDGIFTTKPFFGHRSIRKVLRKKGIRIGKDRVLKYMHILGLKTVYPKKITTIPNQYHEKHPYLLADLEINRPNQVWATDITYIRMHKGFCYLVAIIDWYSRRILSWRLSNSMDTSFCIEALHEAIEKFGTPEIFNTDQGSQFTSSKFISILQSSKIKISMDGKGRAIDNIIIERFWRTIKYENIYLNEYRSMSELKSGVEEYVNFYNFERSHSSLGDKTPFEVHEPNKKKEVYLKTATSYTKEVNSISIDAIRNLVSKKAA